MKRIKSYGIPRTIGSVVSALVFFLFIVSMNYTWFRPPIFFFAVVGIFYLALIIGFFSEALINIIKGHRWNGR